MINYVKNPNFPNGNVTVAAVSSEAEGVISALESAKIAVIPVESCSELPDGIASHADLQILHLGENSVLTASCSKKSTDMLEMMGFNIEKTNNNLDFSYPEDCLINAEIIGRNIIINPDIADEKLMRFAEENNYNIIAVKQGYAKCSVLAVCKDAVITADPGIAKILQGKDIEVLKIKEGGIYLKGFDTGFIGGCGGMIENKILGTSGDLKSIHDYENIKDFLRNRNIYAENLGGRTLHDIGGILPLCEE
ncbi:MAG: hypothetical protein IJ306_10955 [Oscillospiraceae bacterium]|nr:hypothetical protein [Oscillospiraceae bacterium]